MKAVAEPGPAPVDRALGFVQRGLLSAQMVRINTGLRLLQQALAVERQNEVAQLRIADLEKDKSLPEQSIREHEKSVTLLASNKLGMITGQTLDAIKRFNQSTIDGTSGDFQAWAQGAKAYVQTGGVRAATNVRLIAQAAALDHDLAMARTAIGDFANYQIDNAPGNTALDLIVARMEVNSEAQDWAGGSVRDGRNCADGPEIPRYAFVLAYDDGSPHSLCRSKAGQDRRRRGTYRCNTG